MLARKAKNRKMRVWGEKWRKNLIVPQGEMSNGVMGAPRNRKKYYWAPRRASGGISPNIGDGGLLVPILYGRLWCFSDSGCGVMVNQAVVF